MPVLGICVDPNGGNPRLRCVVLSGNSSTPVLEDEFDIGTALTNAAGQTVDLAKLLLGRLPGLSIDGAAVRKASPSPHASRRGATFSRAHTEGAVIYVLSKSLDSDVVVGDPQSFAKHMGIEKSELVLRAKSLTSRRQDAAIAALGQLPQP
jgi:hypothetical protein